MSGVVPDVRGYRATGDRDPFHFSQSLGRVGNVVEKKPGNGTIHRDAFNRQGEGITHHTRGGFSKPSARFCNKPLRLIDQPGIQQEVVEALVHSYQSTGISLLMHSFQRPRRHPWLLARELWPQLLEMRPPETPRDFLNRRSGIIHYVEVNTPSIVEDIDNPEDYLKSKP